MKKSIYIRNFYTTASIVFLSFIILGGVFFFWSYRLLIGEKQKAMSSTAGEVVKFISAFSIGYDLTGFDLSMALSAISQASGFDIFVTDEGGTILSTSDRSIPSPQVGKTVSAAILAEVSRGRGYVRSTHLGGIFAEDRFVMGLPLFRIDGRTVGYIFLSSNSNAMVQLWRQFAAVFLFVAAIVLLLTFVISFITTKRQAEPLNDMARARAALRARRFLNPGGERRTDG